jgi:PAS domain S-box-containing protein
MSTAHPSASSSWSAATALFDAVDEIVCGLDGEGRVVWLNAAGRALASAHGLRADDTAARPLAELVPFALDAQLVEAMRAAREEGTAGQVEFTLPDSERVARVRIVPLPMGMALVVKEVREDRRVQRVQLAYEARYQSLFNAVPVPLVTFDLATGKIRTVNAAALSLFAGSATLIGTPMHELVHPDERDSWEAARKGSAGSVPTAKAGQVGTWRLQRPTGDIIDAEVTLLALDVDGEPARLAMIRDVTEARVAEANRLLLRAALAQINDLLVITSATPMPRVGIRLYLSMKRSSVAPAGRAMKCWVSPTVFSMDATPMTPLPHDWREPRRPVTQHE